MNQRYRSTWYEIVLEDIANLSAEELKKVSNFITFNLENDRNDKK